jgi:hypothetical protein
MDVSSSRASQPIFINLRNLRFDPIVRDDFVTNVLTPLYGHTGSPNVNNIHSHRLSVFFIVLASGVLYEQSTSSGVIAEQYHALSRAALSLDPIYQDATCATVQALFMAFGHIYQSDRTNNEGRWLLMGVVVRVAQLVSIALPYLRTKELTIIHCVTDWPT